MIKLISILLALLTVSGCAKDPVSQNALPKIEVIQEAVRIEMPVLSSATRLTTGQSDFVKELAAEYRTHGNGPLVIFYPVGSSNMDAAQRIVSLARTGLAYSGLEWATISSAPYDASGQFDAPVIFSFDRYEAIVPGCDQSWENIRNAPSDRSWDHFGCSQAINLAAMIAEPRDLIVPRTLTPPDAMRRATVLEKYRAGTTTTAERSNGESGTISDAVDN